MKKIWLLAVVSAAFLLGAAEVQPPKQKWFDPVILENDFIKVLVDKGRGGTVRSVIDKVRNEEVVQEVFRHGHFSGGLSEDRFAGDNYVVPLIWMQYSGDLKREGDTQILRIETIPTDEKYKGKKLVKIFKLRDNDAFYTAEWEIHNVSKNPFVVTPWVHNMILRRGSVFPKVDGIKFIPKGPDCFQSATRNWIAGYNPETKGAVVFCTEFNHVSKQYYCFWNGYHTLEWVYRGAPLKPGEFWRSRYTIGVTTSPEVPVAVIPEASCSLKRTKDALDIIIVPATRQANVTAKAVAACGKVLAETTGNWTPGKAITLTVPKKQLPKGVSEVKIKLSAKGGLFGLLSKKDFPLAMFERYGNELAFDIDGELALAPDMITPTKWEEPPLPYLPVTGKDRAGIALPSKSACKVFEVSAFDKIFEEDRFGTLKEQPQLSKITVRNGFAYWQFVLSNPTDQKVNFNISKSTLVIKNGKTAIPLDIRQVGYIKSTWPSRFDLTTPVGRYPDPLMPVGKYITVPAKKNLPLYISTKVPADVHPGVYKGVIKLSGKTGKVDLPIQLTVSPVTLPNAPFISTYAGCWYLQPKVIAEVKYPGTAAEFQKICRDIYFSRRLTPRELGVPWDKLNDQLQQYLYDLRDKNISSLPVPARIAHNPEKMKIVSEMLKKAGLYEKAYNYTIDEAPAHRFGEIIDLVKIIRSSAPGFRILGTIYEPDVSQLYGYINIWCRGKLQEEPWMEARRKAGDIFVTSNLGGVDLEQQATDVLNFMLKIKQLDWSGYLYWNMISGHRNDNPWREISSSGRNGLGHLIYPHKSGPVITLRFEAIARGNEFFDLLTMLQKADKKAYDALKSRFVLNNSDDIETLYAAIIKALEKTAK